MIIGILNHLGGGNLGDDATFDALVQNIKARRPDVVIRAFSMNAEDTEWRHKVPSYPIRRRGWTAPSDALAKTSKPQRGSATGRKGSISWIPKHAFASALRLPFSIVLEFWFLLVSRRRVRDLDLLIIGGGGQLTERDGAWAFPYTLLKWVLLAKSCRVTCAFLNVGAGPISNRLAKLFTNRALTAADYVSFRDPESQDLARSIGFSGKSHVYPDTVYSLSFSPSAESPVATSAGRVVGISPVPWGDDQEVDSKEKFSLAYTQALTQWTALIRLLVADGYSVRLFGTDIGSDFIMIDDIVALLHDEGASDLPVVSKVRSLEELLAEIASMDYLITSRFHGIIFAHLLQKPVLALATHYKVNHLMSSMGLSQYCENLQGFDPIDMLKLFRALANDTVAVKSRMAKKLAQNRARLRLQFDELFPSMGCGAIAPAAAIGADCGTLRPNHDSTLI